MESTSASPPAAAATSLATRRRRFLVGGVAGLAVLGTALGVSFAGNTGSTSISVSPASTAFVFPVANGNDVPNGVEALKYTSAIDATDDSITTAVTPSWSASEGDPGSVTTAGDIVLFDARSTTLGGSSTGNTGLVVSVYVTNLVGLMTAYSSFLLPVNVFRCDPNDTETVTTPQANCDGTSDWVQASAVVASPPTYLTNTDAFLTFTLPVGYYYVVTIDTGGSFHTIDTSVAANLSPSFYFTATPV